MPNTAQIYNIDSVDMKARQVPLRMDYAKDGSRAMTTDHARSRSDIVPATDPLYGMVEFAGFENNPLKISLHSGVGGQSDLPVPGDILCAAIAGCLDSVIRVAANMVGVTLREVEVHVEADVDLRGTLQMDPKVPVGFTDIRISTHLSRKAMFARLCCKPLYRQPSGAVLFCRPSRIHPTSPSRKARPRPVSKPIHTTHLIKGGYYAQYSRNMARNIHRQHNNNRLSNRTNGHPTLKTGIS